MIADSSKRERGSEHRSDSKQASDGKQSMRKSTVSEVGKHGYNLSINEVEAPADNMTKELTVDVQPYTDEYVQDQLQQNLHFQNQFTTSPMEQNHNNSKLSESKSDGVENRLRNELKTLLTDPGFYKLNNPDKMADMLIQKLAEIAEQEDFSDSNQFSSRSS